MSAYIYYFFSLMEIKYKVESNNSVLQMDPDGIFFLNTSKV